MLTVEHFPSYVYHIPFLKKTLTIISTFFSPPLPYPLLPDISTKGLSFSLLECNDPEETDLVKEEKNLK